MIRESVIILPYSSATYVSKGPDYQIISDTDNVSYGRAVRNLSSYTLVRWKIYTGIRASTEILGYLW